MQLETYYFTKRPASYYYEFFSNGPNGNIKKIVEFYRLVDYDEEVYNLAFGDWDDKGQHFDDLAITNNSDRDKVLATVAATVFEFMKDHPQAIILAWGSTKSRTRLYQMGRARLWDQISLLFEIQGNINSSTKKKLPGKSKAVTDKSVKDYANDPYFIKKGEAAATFLKKVGLPESFKKSQAK